MQPVFNQSSDYGGITDRRVAVTALKAKLAKDDGFVERKGFKVQVGKRITPKYVHSNADAMTIMAIPAVIKNGEIIYQNDDHKLRNYGTVTFGAKVVFNGKEGIMAVSAKITEGNFYTAHRVLKPNGEIFEI
ncbi:MAG: hypothetical protein LBK70_00320 [Clostridiales bacterium]|nr:hypothetical protein [Clostridiales bacterium]